jgi:ferritin-like metal-binding protein YciE
MNRETKNELIDELTKLRWQIEARTIDTARQLARIERVIDIILVEPVIDPLPDSWGARKP